MRTRFTGYLAPKGARYHLDAAVTHGDIIVASQVGTTFIIRQHDFVAFRSFSRLNYHGSYRELCWHCDDNCCSSPGGIPMSLAGH